MLWWCYTTKSSDAKTFGDIFHGFANKVGELSHSALTKVSESTDISQVGMKQILSHKRTKQALTKYLDVKMWEHLRKGVEEFVVAGDGASVNSKNVTLPNNHEESDSLIIHCLTLVEVTGNIVSIYSNDTDVFVTLLGNNHKFSMKRLLMHWSTNVA